MKCRFSTFCERVLKMSSKIYINGGQRLNGELEVQGAKNGALPILAATVLCEGESVIHNCPSLSDVDATIRILEHLGCRCKKEGSTLTVNAETVNCFDIPESLMREMRSSIVLLGAIVSRTGKAKLSSPGGCELGPRPIDLHLSSLGRLGVEIKDDHGFLDCCFTKRRRNCSIYLAFPSVGATENIILASATANGTTVIHNAAREPEILDLQTFINSAGGKVMGAGTDTIVIEGVKHMHGAEHTVIPDRIVAATYMAAAAVTGGDVLLKNTEPSHMNAVLSHIYETGCKIKIDGKTVRLTAPPRLGRFSNIRTMVYPGFPTDAGPILLAMACVADGTTMFVENIFENRYRYADELRRLGADIKVSGRVAVVEGVAGLSGASVESTDLRGGAALVIAGLCASGTTVVGATHHIDRGYEKFEEKLRCLGADIKRV